MKMTPNPDRAKQPSLGRPFSLMLPQIESIKLENGLEFFLIPDATQEVTRLDLVFDAGSSVQDKKLQAAAVNQLLSEGTRQKTSMEIAEILDFHGAYLDRFLSKDKAGLTLFGLTKYYDRLLPLLMEMLTGAVFPEKELKIFDDRKKQEYLINIQKVRYQASSEFNRLVFGADSAYGQVLETDDFGLLTREDLLDFYKKNYQPAGFYGILSGKIDDGLLKLLRESFGQILQTRQTASVRPLHFVAPSAESKILISKKEALQSAIRMGGLTIDRKNADYPKLSLLNTVLGGYFGSRLMTSLREDKGYTYGIYSLIQNYRHATYFAIAAEVNAEYTKAAVDEICRQVDVLRTEKVTEKELQTVKNYVYGSSLRNFDGSFALAERFMKSRELEMPFESYRQTLDAMMQCTAEDILRAARKYLNTDDMKTLVVGNTSSFQD